MSAIKKILSRKELLFDFAEKILYHYTIQEGFLGILNSKKIWATSIFFLNDKQEFNIALNSFQYFVSKNRSSITDIEYQCWNESFNLNAEMIKQKQVFVTSFTENSDQLSQWRGYCPNSSGYCIGFSPERFRLRKDEQGFSLVKCVYDVKTHKEIIEEIFIDYLAARKNIENSKRENLINSFVAEFIQYICPLFKHNTFHEESEWRLVYSPKPLNLTGRFYKKIKFRTGKSTIIPYIEYDLVSQKEKLNLEEIIVGPSPNIDLSKMAVECLISSNNTICSKIRNSNSSYMNW